MTEHNHSAAFIPANRSLEGDLSMPLPEGQGIISSRVFCRVSIKRTRDNDKENHTRQR